MAVSNALSRWLTADGGDVQPACGGFERALGDGHLKRTELGEVEVEVHKAALTRAQKVELGVRRRRP
ncbi:hypothetical protein SAMN05661080_00109 [Modestobacter sp. DSM 44400]|nr:hypothetical protein SAMN05661080_00109 [Modestobacter sp. DSM 44400]